MKVQEVLHMKGGDGENSYAKNSSIQRMILLGEKKVLQEAIIDYYSCTTMVDRSVMAIADLGCSSGPNTLSVVHEIVTTIYKLCLSADRRLPELQLFLNDLPGNDFNSVFRSLPETTGIYFVAGVPGSFYGRLFVSKSINFFHSSSSLHWLSQVPPQLHGELGEPLNKGNIYISKGCSERVIDAYQRQFINDCSKFLKIRALEIVDGGRMVVVLMGRRCRDPSKDECCFYWNLLAKVLMELTYEGVIGEEKIDTFNVPIYCPSVEELKQQAELEGSFKIKCIELFDVDLVAHQDETYDEIHKNKGQQMAKCVRAAYEPMIEAHIGKHIIEDLFLRYKHALDDYFINNDAKLTNIILSLERKQSELRN